MLTSRKLYSIYVQGVITDWQVRNWFSRFNSRETSLEDEQKTSLIDDTLLFD